MYVACSRGVSDQDSESKNPQHHRLVMVRVLGDDKIFFAVRLTACKPAAFSG